MKRRGTIQLGAKQWRIVVRALTKFSTTSGFDFDESTFSAPETDKEIQNTLASVERQMEEQGLPVDEPKRRRAR